MAFIVKMKHKETGIMKDGFFGFSWTTLFFGAFTALFRSDYPTFIVVLLIEAILVGITEGYSLLFLCLMIWAFIYNKYYTLNLLKNSYVFSDTPETNKQAALALGVVYTAPANGSSNEDVNTEGTYSFTPVKIWPIILIFGVIAAIGLYGYSEFKKKADLQVKLPGAKNITSSNGVFLFEKNYDNDPTRNFVADFWVIANTIPGVNTICVYNLSEMHDKYGALQNFKSLLAVAYEDKLNELRKYKDEKFAMNNPLLARDMILDTDTEKRTCPSSAVATSENTPEAQTKAIETVPQVVETEVQQEVPAPEDKAIAEENTKTNPEILEQAPAANELAVAASDESQAQNDNLSELSCEVLWKMRNQIFHDKGYCFQKEKDKKIFDNTGYHYEKALDVPLTDNEKEYVKKVRTVEENKGCVKRTDITLGSAASGATDGNEQYVQNMLNGSAKDDASLIMVNKTALENLPKPAKGDRKAARKINDEALGYFNNKQYEQAANLFDKASQLDPADIEVLNNYGNALLKSGNLSKAWQVLVKVWLSSLIGHLPGLI